MNNHIKILLRESLIDEAKRAKIGTYALHTITNALDDIEKNFRTYFTELITTCKHEIVFNDDLEVVEANGTVSKKNFVLQLKPNSRTNGWHTKSAIALVLNRDYAFSVPASKLYDECGKDIDKETIDGVMDGIIDWNKKAFIKNKEKYRDTLIHEFSHGIDPKLNSKYSKSYSKDYDSSTSGEEFIKTYLTHDVEVFAQTTQFLERLVLIVKQLIKKHPNSEKVNYFIKEQLRQILEAFNQKGGDSEAYLFRDDLDSQYAHMVNTDFMSFTKAITPIETSTFLDKVKDKLNLEGDWGFFDADREIAKNMIDKVKNMFNKKDDRGATIDKLKSTDNNEFLRVWGIIMKYKAHNPKAWKAFLSKLYSTVQECSELVKENEK